MRTETLSTLKINKLSQEQYDRELANGNIDENAIYLTPDTELDLAEVEQTLKEQGDEIEVVKGDLTSHTNSSNAQFTLVREEFANADAETLKSAKEYSDANKNSAIGEAKAYTNQEIEKLVTDTEFEGVLSTIQDIQNAMATDEELAQALETANGKKVDKGAKGSATQPIYFDDNGAQPIAYTIEKSVPADAKFTDTTYTLIKDATNKKIQLMNGDKLVSEVDDNNTTYTIDGSLSTSSTNPIQNKVVTENINNLQKDIDANASEIEEINSKDLFETKHKEGNPIAMSDSAEAPFVGMKLFGNTTQGGTPTPSAPVPLVSVGDSGSFEVALYGNNKCDKPTGATYTIDENGYVIVANNSQADWYHFVLIENPYGEHTISFEIENANLYVQFNSSDYSRGFNKNGSVTVTPNGWLRIMWSTKVGTTSKVRVMCNVGTIALPYEPCNKQTLTMPYTLRSVGEVKDEVDFARGVFIQRLGKANLTSDLTYNANRFDTDNSNGWDTVFFYTSVLQNQTSPQATTNAKSNYLAQADCYSKNTVGFYTQSAIVGFRIPKTLLADTSTVSKAQQSVKNWLSDKTITVIYELATPIEIPLSEADLNAYRQLMTNKPNTTILSEADMEVDYVVDSTSAEYIENRLDTLKSDIDKISSGGSSLATVAITGDYNDLSNKPTIPTKTSQLTNDSSFINQTGLNNALEDKLSFDEEVINSTSDVTKVVPEGSGKYATINKVGGMSYKSRNLLEITGVTATVNGVTFTVNDNGSVHAKGTATAQANFFFNAKDGLKHLVKGKTYKSIDCSFELVKKDGTITYPATFTYDDTVSYLNILTVLGAGTVIDKFYYPMVIESTETNTIYEPYYSGIRSAAVNKIISNSNLIDEKALVNTSGGNYTEFVNGQLHLVNTTGTTYASKTISITVPKGKWYVKMKTYSYTTQSPPVGMLIVNGTPAYISGVATTGTTYTFDSPTTMQVKLTTHNQNQIGEAYCNLWLTPVINAEYKPYKENVLEIPTGARKIGYGLGINEDCYNYIDFERGVYVQKCKKVNLSTLNWGLSGNGKQMSSPDLVNQITPPINNDKKANILCSTYANDTANNVWLSANDKSIAVNASGQICIYDSNYTDVASFKASLTDTWLIYALTTPEEIDISIYLQDNNFLEAATGGVITAVNEYNYDAPTEISFFTSENPEKVIVADKIAGDLVGVAEEAQSLTGLDSTIEELNYLHKEAVTKEGWIIPEEGTVAVELLYGAQGVIGFKIGNTYTFTITYKDGTIETDNVIAIDSADWDCDPGAVILQCGFNEKITIIDKASIDSDYNITVGTNHYWYPPSVTDEEIVSILVTGTKSDGTALTHVEEIYNKIPEGYLPDNISADPPIKQYWEWTSSDTNSLESDLGFEKPDGYNRCRILIYDRNITSGGVLGVSMPIIWPIARERGSDTMWYDIDTVGRTLEDVKLGNGEGENQTWGGTEWISTVSIDVYFTDKGFMCNYVCGTNSFSGKTVTAGSGYPETYAGQISGVLSEDADIDSILDPSLVWTLGVFLQQNKGNYVEVTWYKD